MSFRGEGKKPKRNSIPATQITLTTHRTITPARLRLCFTHYSPLASIPFFLPLLRRARQSRHGVRVAIRGGSYCKARYTPVQSRQPVEFFREFCDAGELMLETVGAVGGGEYVWALARVQEEAIAIDGDVIEPYLLIANSHVPGRSLVVKNTQVRVVCNNTLTMALAENAQTYGRFVYTQSVHAKIARAKDYVGAALAYNRKFKAAVHALVATRVTETFARELVGECFEIKSAGAKADRIPHLFQGGQIGTTDLVTTNGNAWGLLKAATQYIDHEAGHSAEARVKSAWFGRGEGVKRRLLGRLLQTDGVLTA